MPISNAIKGAITRYGKRVLLPLLPHSNAYLGRVWSDNTLVFFLDPAAYNLLKNAASANRAFNKVATLRARMLAHPEPAIVQLRRPSPQQLQDPVFLSALKA